MEKENENKREKVKKIVKKEQTIEKIKNKVGDFSDAGQLVVKAAGGAAKAAGDAAKAAGDAGVEILIGIGNSLQ